MRLSRRLTCWASALCLVPTVALIALVTSCARAADLTGRVVAIADGDTFTLLDRHSHQVRVRLAEIDTPEAGQPYSQRARQALSDMVFGRQVRVAIRDTDRYGRTVGRVYVAALDINAEMIRQGAAWVYRQYSTDPSLLRLETEARIARRGIWALPEAERTPPWEWRAHRRSSRDASGVRQRVALAPISRARTRVAWKESLI